MVQTLVERGVDVEDGVQQGKMAPMIAACMLGRLEIAKYLFAHDARIIGVCFKRRFAPLHQACDHNHVEVVQWLVENGANIDDSCSGIGATPVAIAAMRGHLRIVKYLVSQGANTARPIPMRGTTLRYLCAWKGNLGMLKYLMENKIGKCSRSQRCGDLRKIGSAIIAAVRGGHNEVVRYLLLHKEASARDITECLHQAIEKKQLEFVDLSLKYGADVHECASGDGYSAIHEMAARGDMKMLEAVTRIKGAEVDFSMPSNQEGELPLHIAAENGRAEVVRFLLQKLPECTSINVLNEREFNPLMYASQKGHFDVVQILVERGAPIDSRLGRSTPLVLASEAGYLDVVKYLCENGANVNNSQLGGSISFIAASRKGQLEVVQYLCENGANVNSNNGNGTAPVVAAAKYGHLAVVEYLLEEHRAKLSIQTAAVDEAVRHSFCDVARALLSHSAHLSDFEEDQSDFLCHALINNRVDMVKLLVQSGVDVNARYFTWANGERMVVTPLVVAASSASLEFVRFLCEYGAEVEATTDRNESPLYVAALFGRVSVVNYLVKEQRACFERADAVHGFTPVEVASCMSAYDVEHYLLAIGAVPPKRESYIEINAQDTSSQEAISELFRREEESEPFLVRRRAFEHFGEGPLSFLGW